LRGEGWLLHGRTPRCIGMLACRSEIYWTQFVLFDVHIRKFGPYLATVNRILIPAMDGCLPEVNNPWVGWWSDESDTLLK
jgi:hypothetical protein